MRELAAVIRGPVLVVAVALIGLCGNAFAQSGAGLEICCLDLQVPFGVTGPVATSAGVTFDGGFFFNGSPILITGVSVASGSPWLTGVQMQQSQPFGNQFVFDLDTSTLSPGAYFGGVTVSTTAGSQTFPVTLEYGERLAKLVVDGLDG